MAIMKIKKLNKSFGKKSVLKNFSYEFADKGIYVVKGDSGVGKTTLFRIISGLDKEFDGEIIGGGIGKVSYCFQEYRLFDALSAIENVTKISFDIATKNDIDATKIMLNRLGFSDEQLSLFPRQLSGGMRQRVAFTRAVMKKTPILILDEPTKEVDGKIREEMIKIIKESAHDRLVLIVAHNQDDIDALDAKIINL